MSMKQFTLWSTSFPEDRNLGTTVPFKTHLDQDLSLPVAFDHAEEQSAEKFRAVFEDMIKAQGLMYDYRFEEPFPQDRNLETRYVLDTQVRVDPNILSPDYRMR